MNKPLDTFTQFPELHDALIEWFAAHKQDLPWRQNGDPYAIWISEIMLQQTQVGTVIPYYTRFMTAFPTVRALAAADQGQVLKLWEGLGYYSRARNLHRAAQIIVQEFDGVFPEALPDMRRLPGIGPYTAGAVASLAFGQDAALLDGNVIRILTRLFDIGDDVGQHAIRQRLWQLAENILPPGRAAAWNEGLMELGRLVCTPRQPDCAACPVNQFCEARKQGTVEQRPVKKPKAKTPHVDVTAGVIADDHGRLLIAQRRQDGMLGGLWEFPGGKRESGETLVQCLQREILEELGIEIAVGEQIGVVQHAYTHLRITLYAFRCQYVSGEPQALEVSDWKWVTPASLQDYAFPVTDQKIIAMLDHGGQIGMDLSLSE